MDERELVNMLEDHLLLHADNMAAISAITADLPALRPGHWLSSLEALRTGLQAMGLSLGSSLPWERLGLCWDEGPLPDEGLIEA